MEPAHERGIPREAYARAFECFWVMLRFDEEVRCGAGTVCSCLRGCTRDEQNGRFNKRQRGTRGANAKTDVRRDHSSRVTAQPSPSPLVVLSLGHVQNLYYKLVYASRDILIFCSTAKAEPQSQAHLSNQRPPNSFHSHWLVTHTALASYGKFLYIKPGVHLQHTGSPATRRDFTQSPC